MKKSFMKTLMGSTIIAGSILAAGGVASAQSADEDDADEIVVTGSRISRPNLQSSSPITTVDRAELIASGVTDVGDLIQSLPSMSGSPIGTTTNNGGNGNVNIDLRGLGGARTLTLVNGQRTVDGGDFQTIPGVMIKKIDVLKDGASAVYGADAVSGVVNIVTRSEFDGIEITGRKAIWDETSGGGQDLVAMIAGKNFDGGNFVFGAEYVQQEEAYQRDTPWDFFQDSFYIYPGGCEAQVAAPYDGTPQGGCYPIGSSRIPESRIGFLTQGTFIVGTPAATPYETGLLAPFDGRNYNYAPVNYVQTPYNKLNAYAEGHFDLNDTTRFNVELRANRRESAQELAPQPYNSPTDPAFSGVFNGVAYNGISEDNYYLRRAVDQFNAANPGATPLAYEPVRDARRRMIETTRRFEQNVSQVQGVMSLEGEWDNVNWDVYTNYGFRNFTQQDFGQFSGAQLSNALGPSADLNGDGQPECYGDINDPSSIIVGCVPFNFFGGGSVDRATGNITASSVTQDMIDYVSSNLNDTTDVEFFSWGGGLNGDGWELPGGKLGWAIGAGGWTQSIVDTPDSGKQLGTVTGNKGGATSGELKNLNLYGELLLPLYDNGVQNLTVTAGGRYDDFEDIAGKETYQLGFQGSVLPTVKLRGTYGTVFRVPTVFDLFQGASDSFPQFADPCRVDGIGQAIASDPAGPAPGCARTVVQLDTQVLARVGGNPNLKPELGDSTTLGIVWTPDFIQDHNISLTVDYFKTEIEDGILSVGVNQTLQSCYVDLNQAACGLITRRAGDFTISSIVDTQLNLSSDIAEGVDVEARWAHDAGFADLSASMIWSHNLKRDRVRFAGEDTIEFLGRYVGQSFAEDKVNYSIAAERGAFKLTYRGEYISELSNGVAFIPTYTQTVDAQLYHDLVATYDIDMYNADISAGVTNLTNESPPYIDGGFNASTDPTTYRTFGRGFWVRGTKRF